MENLPLYIFSGISAAFLAAVCLRFTPWTRAGKAAVVSGYLFCASGVAAILILEKRLPVFGMFESVLYISFFLCVFDFFSIRALAPETGRKLSGQIYAVILILMLFQLNEPMTFNPDFFMYANLWVNLFFNLRLTAAAFFIYAALLFLNSAWTSDQTSGDGKKHLMKQGRNFLLAGSAVYLASEWSGSLWCMNWLGDSWRWSRGFFKASAVFLLAMTALHLPPVLKQKKKARAVFSSLPALFLVWMILYH